MILNVGCGGTRSSDKFTWYGDIRIDLEKSKNVTLLADAHYLPFKDETFDTVIGFEVIEHLVNPSQGLTEMKRVLKSHGIILISIPNVWVITRIVRWLWKGRELLKHYGHLGRKGLGHRQGWDIYEFHSLAWQLDLKIINIYWINRTKPSIKRRILQFLLPREFSRTHLLVKLTKA